MDVNKENPPLESYTETKAHENKYEIVESSLYGATD